MLTLSAVVVTLALGAPVLSQTHQPGQLEAPQAQQTAASSVQAPPAQPQGPPQGPGPGSGMGHGMGHGKGGAMDAQHQADMELFHYLGDHGKEITRAIKVLPDGVETVTESDNPEVASRIQAHVLSMAARVKEQRPIHRRDPLFAEVFAHADKIEMRHENTPKGVKVVETSGDPYVVRLIQAHAEVVSLFITHGRQEMMKNHEVPARPAAQ